MTTDNQESRNVNIARKIDGKFGITIDWESHKVEIVNLVSGEAIPLDEPLMLLRARDSVASTGITAYLSECEEYGCNELHLAGVQQVREKFYRFAVEHPERMKQPGVTRHLKLEKP